MISAKERYLFVEQMFEKLSHLSIEEIISLRIELKPYGRHYKALCPFHNDTHYGSFYVTPSMGIWKCFTCDVGGNGIKFISQYDNIDYLHAAFKVAFEKNLISIDEYNLYSQKGNFSSSYSKSLEKKHTTIHNSVNTPCISKEIRPVCNNIYKLIQQKCGLSSEHFSHLQNVRMLSEERIKQDYFSFPDTSYKKNKIIKEIQAAYPEYTNDILMKVPGFYYDKKYQKVSFYGPSGIGILIHSTEGYVIQIRRDHVKEGQPRYTWFSSAFALYDEKYEGGAGPGSPRDILYPDKKGTNICITEGRFKSEVIRQAGNVAISLQGVSSQGDQNNSIVTDVKHIMKEYPIKRVYLMFDADGFSKPQVYKQLKRMINTLSSSLPDIKVFVCCWHISDGKGIDDVYINGKIATVKYILPSEYIDTYEGVFQSLLKKWNFSSERDVLKSPIEIRDKFYSELQSNEENAFLGN